jgi:D-glycero-D-manno-heptose 1,7-bisphosphate phosphatase
MTKAHDAHASQHERPIRWVFLDRDGTLNVKAPDGEYVERPEALELLPGAADAVRMLNRAGLWTGVVTNQRGVALGRMSIEDLNAVHARLEHLLRLGGAFVDAIYTCPHGIGVCDCRKPQPGLLLKAQSEHPTIDFAYAAIVGDSLSDVQAGKRLGLRTVLISGGEDDRDEGGIADRCVPDLIQAATVLLKMQSRPGAYAELPS